MSTPQPSGIVEHTPFFFLINRKFAERTGFVPLRELHVATQMVFQSITYTNDPETGFATDSTAVYSVHLMDHPDPLVIHSGEMHAIDSHFPDGILKVRLKDDFLCAAQILHMVRYPVHWN